MPYRTRSLTLALLFVTLPLHACREESTPPGPVKPTAPSHDHADHDDHDHSGHDHAHDEKPDAGQGDKHDHDHDHDDHKHEGSEDHAHDDHAHDEKSQGRRVKLSAEAIKSNGLRTEPVSSHVFAESYDGPALVSLNKETLIHIGTPLTGRITELHARLGEDVEFGEALLTIHSIELADAQNEFIGKQRAVVAAGPAVDLAKSAYDRAKALYEGSRGITLSEVQRREMESNAARASLASAQADAQTAENRLHLLGFNHANCTSLSDPARVTASHVITAPMAGRVIELRVALGETVAPEGGSLLVVADPRTVWVIADVPEMELQNIVRGAPCYVSTGVDSGTRIEGVVSWIAPQLDPTTRTGAVRITVHTEKTNLRPGTFVQAHIPLGKESGPRNLGVPEAAVQTIDGTPTIFIAVEGQPGVFEARTIKVGDQVGSSIPVLSGVKAGESVVVAGSFLLKAELGKSSAAHEH